MINFPKDFVQTKVPGYFWSVDEKWLYSIKSGTLKFLARTNYIINTRRGPFEGWAVSHNGSKVYLTLEYLSKLNADTPAELQVARKADHKPELKVNSIRTSRRMYGTQEGHRWH